MATVIGQYQGQDIFEGTNAEVAEQMRKIESVPVADIQETKPVNVPAPVPTSSQMIDQITQEARLSEARAQQEFDTSRQTLQSRVTEATDVMGSRERLEEESGLDELRTGVADITNQIEAREHALRRAIEGAQKQTGLSQAQRNRNVQALTRDATRELADLSIIQGARLRNFEAVETSIDRKIQARLEPLKLQLQFDQMFYQENRQLLTSAQDKAFQLKIAQEERLYQSEQREQESIKNIAISAAQYGATPEQVKQITDATNFSEAMSMGGGFLGEPFRLQVEAQQFQQEMAVKSYNLQVRSQSFTEQMQRQSLALQAQQLEESILARMQESNIKANAEFANTDEAKSMQVVKGQVGTLNQMLESTVGSSDRNKLNWELAAKDMSVVKAIANAEARALNPDLSRASAGGDLNAETSLLEIAERTFQKYTRGDNVRPVDLQNAVRLVDSAYQSRLQQAQEAQRRVETLYPSSQVISTYNSTAPAPLRSQIQVAEQQGYKPADIIAELMNNPLFKPQIEQAFMEGYTPLSILNFLKTQ